MPKIAYKEDLRFDAAQTLRIQRANTIIEDYQERGLTLTLRQLYYQFVSRDWLPNTDKSYDSLGNTITRGRMAGLIDWNAIEDRGRAVKANSHWYGPESIIEAVAEQYQIDKWKGQAWQPEVWVEKEALVGLIAIPSKRLDVPYFACKGYASVTSLWEASRRFNGYMNDKGREPVIIHLGDHDPSGIDMTRDIADRMETFCDRRVKVERIALTMEQVDHYRPPPNPAKLTDVRSGYNARTGEIAAGSYIDLYGRESWELDALDPDVLMNLIETAVLNYRNEDTWDMMCERERAEKSQLAQVSAHWRDVAKFVTTLPTAEEPTPATKPKPKKKKRK